MKTLYRATAKQMALSLALVAFSMFNQGVAQAEEVTFTGSVTGTLSGTTTGLIYLGSTFSITTSGGVGILGSSSTPPFNFNNLGSLTQVPGAGKLNGILSLTVTFFSPTVMTPSNQIVMTAVINGNVGPPGEGGVEIDFAQPQILTRDFAAASGSPGTFSFEVPNFVAITPASTISLYARIKANINSDPPPLAMPEPASLLLLATGLVGVGSALRKRRKANKNE